MRDEGMGMEMEMNMGTHPDARCRVQKECRRWRMVGEGCRDGTGTGTGTAQGQMLKEATNSQGTTAPRLC